jgi:hypothetical protein
MVEDTLRMIRRREFLAGAAAVVAVSTSPEKAGAQAQGWKAGAVQHLLPTVNGDRILLKASFHEARKDAPVLHVDDRQFVGERTDSEGSFWQFDAAGLEPAREHTLVLTDMRARPLCDQWPLATFPALDDRPKQLRLLIFTCAGGHDGLGKHLPIATRVRLLKRGLSFKPQAVIANGDHVYWDLRTRRSRQSGASAEAAVIAGRFDRTAPVLGSPNEAVLKKAVGPQIIPLYTTLCRSTPVFFMQDDHDYFENDEADDHFISFPPDHFMMAAGRGPRVAAPLLSGIPARSHAAVRIAVGLGSGPACARFRKLRHVALWAACRSDDVRLPPLLDHARAERRVRAIGG